VFAGGEWDVSPWDESTWEQTDTELGDWLDVTCDVLDESLSVSAGSSKAEGVVTRWEAATASLSLYGDEYNPRIGQWAGLLTPGLPVRIRWRPYPARTIPAVFARAADGWLTVFLGTVADEGFQWDPTTKTAALTCTDHALNLVGFEAPELDPPYPGGDTAAERIDTLADIGYWPTADRDITAGGVDMQASTMAGSLWAQMLNIADSDLALLWVKRDGRLAFRPEGRAAQGVPVEARLVACPPELPEPPPPPLPRNLLTSAMNDFEDGNVTDWSVSGGTITASTTRARHGAWSMQITATAGSPQVFSTAAGTAAVPVTGGTTVTVMCSVWTPGTGGIALVLNPFNAAGTALAQLHSGTLPVASNTWVDVRTTFALPAAAAFVRWRVVVGAPGLVSYIDRLGLYAGDVPSDQWSAWQPPAGGVRNLLPEDNVASAESGIGQFYPSGSVASLASSSTRAVVGGRSLQVNGSATVANPLVNLSPTAQNGIAIKANTTYTMMATVYADALPANCNLGFQVWDAAGAGIGGTNFGTAFPLTLNAWTVLRRTFVTAAGAAYLMPNLNFVTSGAFGRTFWADRIGLFEGDIPTSEWVLPTAYVPPYAHNLFPYDNFASLEEGHSTGFGTNANGTFAVTQEHAAHGVYGLRYTASGAVNPNFSIGGLGTAAIPVKPSTIYTLLSYVWTDVAAEVINLGFYAYDAAGTILPGPSWGPNFTTSAGGWTLLARRVITQATAAFLRPQFAYTAKAVGNRVFFDKIGLFEGNVVPWAWTLPSAYAPDDAVDVQYVNLLDVDPDILRNWVEVSRAKPPVPEGDPEPPDPLLVTLRDDPSIARFRTHHYSRTDLEHVDDEWTQTVAEVLLGEGAWPSRSPNEVELDSRVDPAAAAILLDLEPEHVFSVQDAADSEQSWRMSTLGWKVDVSVATVAGSIYLMDVSGWEQSGGWDDPVPAGWDYTTWGL